MAAVRSPAGDPRSILAAHRLRAARGRRRRRWILLWLLIAVIVGLSCFAAGLLAAPINYNLQPVVPSAIRLLDDHGRPFATIQPPQRQEPVSGSDIPAVMKQAIVAAEDQRFYSETGVDPVAIIRAAWSDLTGGTFSGASTITQQYVKDVYSGTTAERTPLRKLREAVLAIRLDAHVSKSEILTRYLNNVYLGNGTKGVQAASQFYFGVPVDRLDYDPRTGKISAALALARAATLAGLVPAPSYWNPVASPKQARAREIYVLNRMVAHRDVSSQLASEALGRSLPLIVARPPRQPATLAPQFRDIVDESLLSGYHNDNLLFGTGGLTVTTTLDLGLQRAAVNAIKQVLPGKSQPEAAVVAVDPRNGDIRALATKQQPPYKALGFDVADPNDPVRSSGSTIKPFTLAVALEHGHKLDEVHYAPGVLQLAPGYQVQNDDPQADVGDYTLDRALADSVNTVYAPLGVQVGLSRVARLARAAGMDIGHLDRGCQRRGQICDPYALGMPVTPLSEADAYGAFVNGGIHHAVRSVLSVHSNVDGSLPAPPVGQTGNRVMPAAVADQVQQAMGEVVEYGTGVAARQPFPVYGKTGTTNHYTDAWFTGCTPTLCVTVWMGYNNGSKQMTYDGGLPVYGGTLPAKIFAAFYAEQRKASGTSSPSP